RQKCGNRVRLSDNQAADAAGGPTGTKRQSRPHGIVRRAAHAAKSVAKTSVGIDRASDQQVEARLKVCRHCPGNHAVWRHNGKTITPQTAEERDRLRTSGATVFTCGPMLEQQTPSTSKTRGCTLNKKARDLAEDCPNEWWPKAEHCQQNIVS